MLAKCATQDCALAQCPTQMSVSGWMCTFVRMCVSNLLFTRGLLPSMKSLRGWAQVHGISFFFHKCSCHFWCWIKYQNSIQLAFGIVPYGMPSIMEGALQLFLCQATVTHCVIPIIEGEPPPPRSTPWGAYRPAISCEVVPLLFGPCWQHSCSLTHSR